MRYHAPSSNGLDVYRSSSIAKGMPIGLSLVGSAPCSDRNGVNPPVCSGFRPETLVEELIENSLVCHFAGQADDDGYRFIHLRNLRGDCSPNPSCPALSELDRPEDHLRSQLPALAATRAVVPTVESSGTCFQTSFFFSAETAWPACSRIGVRPLSCWSRDVNGACDRSSFSESPGPGQFGYKSQSL